MQVVFIGTSEIKGLLASEQKFPRRDEDLPGPRDMGNNGTILLG